jgi:hypothetical protein
MSRVRSKEEPTRTSSIALATLETRKERLKGRRHSRMSLRNSKIGGSGHPHKHIRKETPMLARPQLEKRTISETKQALGCL